jgi:hypothetical protein
MQRSIVPIVCLLVLLTTGTAHADDPTAEAPRPARFHAWLPFVRAERAPHALRLTTEARLGGPASGVAIEGGRGYQVQAGRLLVWDLADGDAATVIGHIDLPWADAPGQVTVDDGIAVVLQQRRCASVSASDAPELRARDCVQAAIVDTHDGRAPTLLSTIPIDGQSALMSRWGDWLYVAATIDEDGFGADPSMLLAYDLRRPATPTLTGRLDGLPVMRQLVAGADLVAASGTKGDGSGRLLLFETRSGHPRLLRDLPVGEREVDCLFTVGDRLWLIGRNRDLLSWRWRSGTRFDEQAAATLPDETLIVDAAMELDGQLCTFDGVEESVRGGARPHNQLACFDVSDPSAPAPTIAVTVPADEPLRLPAAEGSRLLLSAPNRGAIVLVDPRRAEGDRIRMLDRGAGAIDSLVRRGAQLYSWEYQGRLRRWDLGAPIGPGSRGVDALAAEDLPIISTDLSGEGPAGRWLVRGRRVSGFPNFIELVSTEVDDPSRTVRGSDLRVNLRGCAGETYVASGDLVMIGETRCSGIPELFQTLLVSDAGFTPASVPDLDAVSDQVLWLGSRPVVLNRDQPDGASLTVVDDDYRTVLARLGDLGAVSAAAIVGRRAYLATTVDGLREVAELRVVDLADPRHPTLVGGTELPLAETAYLHSSATRLMASGWARRPGDHRGELEPALCIVDVGAVAPPVVAGCARDTPLPRTPTSWALDPDGQHLYVAGNGLTVLRVELP